MQTPIKIGMCGFYLFVEKLDQCSFVLSRFNITPKRFRLTNSRTSLKTIGHYNLQFTVVPNHPTQTFKKILFP